MGERIYGWLTGIPVCSIVCLRQEIMNELFQKTGSNIKK